MSIASDPEAPSSMEGEKESRRTNGDDVRHNAEPQKAQAKQPNAFKRIWNAIGLDPGTLMVMVK